ncbi:MAG TPA: hypothetical protein P5531_07205 [Bacteroidales bacterium]|nr:hypothetical protein [Bacteroidales bacterium]
MDTRDDIEKVFPELDDRDEKPACFPDAGNNPFSIPRGYFDTLAERVVQSCESGTHSMKGRRWSMVPALYAAAAVFLLGLAVIAILLSGEKSNNEPVLLTQQLDSRSKDSKYSGSTADSLLPAAASIDQLISRQASGEATAAFPATPIKQEQASNSHEQVLNNISDEEIIEFLLQEDIDVTDLTY